ncbi:MAG: hemerythrin domain-containing protein [Polyangiaceae bacterium]|nr:hemerythrin domain-containing protein [Polyangiaceae bacterium]
MASSSTTDDRNTVLDEHRGLTLTVNRVDDWVTSDEHFGPEWAPELTRRVSALVEQLRMHFSGEPESNLFNEIREKTPHLSGRLSALALEHSEILKAFRDVVEGAKSLSAGPQSPARLALMTRRAISILRRHEAEENELIMRAFWDDMGGLD